MAWALRHSSWGGKAICLCLPATSAARTRASAPPPQPPPQQFLSAPAASPSIPYLPRRPSALPPSQSLNDGRHRTLRALWYARRCALRCAHSSSLGQSFDAVRPQPVGSTLSYLRDGARCLCFFTQVLLSVWTIWTVRTLTIETASKFGQSSRPFPWRRAQSLASHASDGQWSGRSGPREQS